MRLQLLRHATLFLEYAGARLLVDPMLSPAGAMDPVQNAASQARIPLVPLPFPDAQLSALLTTLTGVLVTHLHRDHWDAAAAERLAKDLPLLCQPGDEARLSAAGFTAVTPILQSEVWRGLTLTRTGGQHGTGEIGQRMGPVSGFVLRAAGEPTLYLAGDTIWCPPVAEALAAYAPEVVVVNAGAATFLEGDPITMSAYDVVQVCRACPAAQVVAVHMETINHCLLTRAELRRALEQAQLGQAVHLPADGEGLEFARSHAAQ